jgi:hypothetical protein
MNHQACKHIMTLCVTTMTLSVSRSIRELVVHQVFEELNPDERCHSLEAQASPTPVRRCVCATRKTEDQ